MSVYIMFFIVLRWKSRYRVGHVPFCPERRYAFFVEMGAEFSYILGRRGMTPDRKASKTGDPEGQFSTIKWETASGPSESRIVLLCYKTSIVS